MEIIFYIYLILTVNQTTLVDPPGQLARYNHVSMKMAEVLLGKKIDIGRIGYIDCVKLKKIPRGANPKDYRFVLTLYGTDEKNHKIIYNNGLVDIVEYGKKGSGKGEFFRPEGIVGDSNGNIFVCDMFNNRIVHLLNEGDSLRWIGSFGSYGFMYGEYNRPMAIDMDGCGHLYISDTYNNRVVITDTTGVIVDSIVQLKRPIAIKAICKKNQMYRRENAVYVIDMLGTRISKFDMDAKKVIRVNDYDINLKDAYFTDLDMDLYGNVYVVDKNNNVIHKFDSNLNFITSFGGKGTKRGEFRSPSSLTIYRPYGWFYIAERRGLSYYWLGTDGDILAFTPDTFSTKMPGVTITLYITSESKIKIKIYNDKGELVRNLLPVIKRKIGKVHIVWDGLDDKGRIVKAGRYRIEISLNALYASRSYFTKKIEGFVYVKDE